MVNTYRDGAGEGVEGTDCLTRRRGLYMKNYEFLECHEWWIEMKAMQLKRGEGPFFSSLSREL